MPSSSPVHPPLQPSASPTETTELGLSFSGSGSEYLRIWIVNLVLTLLTLGIYSAWAKVRREKFFHQHTHLAGTSFDYHGRPQALLRGRILAFGLLALTQLDFVGKQMQMVAWLVIIALLPWLMQRSVSFRLANTSYRGVRFAFNGRALGAYKIFAGYAMAAVLALGVPMLALAGGAGGMVILVALLGALVLYPMANASWRLYLVRHARFGNEPFAADFTRRSFVVIYLKTIGLLMALMAAAIALVLATGALDELLGDNSPGKAGPLAQASGALFALLLYVVAQSMGPLIGARLQNLCWQHTTIGSHRLVSRLDIRKYLRLQLVNLGLTLATLGLYRPFAAVANARMRVGAIALLPHGSLDDILASIDAAREVAIGSEAMDLLGIDLSL